MARREYHGVYPYPAAGGRTLYRAFYTDLSGVPPQKRGPVTRSWALTTAAASLSERPRGSRTS